MNVLITGGSGFIGSHLATQLQGKARVRVLDNLRTGHRRNLQGLDVEFIEGSILDRDLVTKAMQGIDYVFHLAALVSVPESVSRPAECTDINVNGLINVLDSAAAQKVRKVCLASSAAVYGDNPEVPKRETMPPEPRSPYAVTKLVGEYYCQLYAEQRGLETVALRFFNVFGPRQDPKGAYAAAVPIFFQQAFANAPITIHGDGGQTRDFISVKDIAAALLFAATKPGLTGTFNAGYGGQLTILELAQRIVAMSGSKSEIRHAPSRAGDVRHSRADVSKLTAAGFKPTGSLDSGLQEMVAYLREHPVAR